jgi:hypothetical protein
MDTADDVESGVESMNVDQLEVGLSTPGIRTQHNQYPDSIQPGSGAQYRERQPEAGPSTPSILTRQPVKPKKLVHSFLEQLASETTASKGKARLELARKRNEKSRHVQRRRKQRERMRQMAKDLETTEAQIQLVEGDIKHLETVVEEGTDGEDE